jgi:hypothetical protein
MTVEGDEDWVAGPASALADSAVCATSALGSEPRSSSTGMSDPACMSQTEATVFQSRPRHDSSPGARPHRTAIVARVASVSAVFRGSSIGQPGSQQVAAEREILV